jgi:sulfite oxidase
MVSGALYTYKKYRNKNFYTEDQIKQHNTENDAWVSYKSGVYDITKFIECHPGGKDKIMSAAGKPLEPYWELYQQHYTDDIYTILEDYKIGTTDTYSKKTADPYINEPIRNNTLTIHKNKPYNAEADLIKLRKHYITPTENIFVRNHHPVPIINPDTYYLTLTNKYGSINLSLNDIKKDYPHHTVTSTIQCAGNRRSEFNKIDKTLGLPWKAGAIYNAKWTGVYLKDILLDHELFLDEKYVHFIGQDNPYDSSISINKVMDSNQDVLLAFKLNDEDIPADHGYPLRAIVPGYFGGKNVKWLKEIRLSNKESDSTWQRGVAYKGLAPNIKDITVLDKETIESIPTIEELPIQSIICDLVDQGDDKVLVKGIAYSGGGKKIVRVDVSNDNGSTWKPATLEEGSEQERNRSWGWTFWSIKMSKKDSMEIVSKAIDSSYNTQPNKIETIWNRRGILNNSVFRYLFKENDGNSHPL